MRLPGRLAALHEWRQQKRSAWLYRSLAESDQHRAPLFRALADAADRQAAAATAGPAEGGETSGALAALPALPPYRPPLRARLVAALARRLGIDRARPLLTALNLRGLTDLRHHRVPPSAKELGTHHGRGASGTLRAAVFGVSDGLVSNTSLLLGVAGAGAEPRAIVLAGLAGLLAGAFSMAAGEYISVRSQRELFESQIADEREELERFPQEEAEELALIYAARGIPVEQAREMARTLVRDRDKALDALAREELGLDPDDLGSPWGAAITSFVSFALGAILPLLPFLIAAGQRPLGWVAGVAAIALFGIGSAISLFSGTSALRGGLRMLIVGALAGGATFLIGRAFGIGLS